MINYFWQYVSKSVVEYGNWETEYQDTLFNQIFHKHPRAAFIDIGGNIGVFRLDWLSWPNLVKTVELKIDRWPSALPLLQFWLFGWLQKQICSNNNR